MNCIIFVMVAEWVFHVGSSRITQWNSNQQRTLLCRYWIYTHNKLLWHFYLWWTGPGELVNQSKVNSCSNLSLENHTITCAEGFYLDNSGANSMTMCIPLCGYWISTSRYLGNAVVEAISLISAIISSLIMVVLAFWLQRDTMWEVEPHN